MNRTSTWIFWLAVRISYQLNQVKLWHQSTEKPMDTICFLACISILCSAKVVSFPACHTLSFRLLQYAKQVKKTGDMRGWEWGQSRGQIDIHRLVDSQAGSVIGMQSCTQTLLQIVLPEFLRGTKMLYYIHKPPSPFLSLWRVEGGLGSRLIGMILTLQGKYVLL